MRRGISMICGAIVLSACAPKTVQLPAGTAAVAGFVAAPLPLELRLLPETREVPSGSDPLHRVCVKERVVRLQALDADGILLWERSFPRFAFARVDDRGVVVGLEGDPGLLAFDQDGRPRADAPARSPRLPSDAVTLENARARKPNPRASVDVPAVAYGSPEPSSPMNVSQNAPWIERVAAAKFASFDDTRLLSVSDLGGRVLWSLGLPEATAVAFNGRELVVTEQYGDFRMTIDGEFLSQPSRPEPVPYEAPLVFERVKRGPGGPLFIASNGEFLGAFQGKIEHLVGSTWKPMPKVTFDDLRGFIELPDKTLFAHTTYANEVGGLATSTFSIGGTQPFPGEPPATDNPRLAVAHGADLTAYAGYNSLVVVSSSDSRTKKLAATPLAVAIHQGRVFLQTSGWEFNPPLASVPKGTVPCSSTTRDQQVIAELVGDKLVRQPVALRGPITAMGVEGDRLWVAGRREFAVLRGETWTTLQSPLESVAEFWSPRAGVIWAVGVGGVARFDGSQWRRVTGINTTGLSIRGRSEDDVWISSLSGVFHGTRQPVPATRLIQLKSEVIAKPARWNPQALSPKIARLSGVRHFALPRLGDRPFHPHAATWVRDKLVLSDGKAHALWDPERPTRLERLSATGKSRLCFYCAALDDQGELWAIRDNELVTSSQSRLAGSGPDLGPIRAVAAAKGSLWAVGEVAPVTVDWSQEQQRPTDRTPVQLAQRNNGVWQQYAGLLPATYLSVSARDPYDLWLAGAILHPLSGSQDDGADSNFPRGEGIIAHLRGNTVEHFRSRLGTVWAIAEDGANSAWAVGVAGQILHVADAVEGFTLPTPIYLRDVATLGASERWIVGDHSTILHGTSAGWEMLESEQIPADQTLTRVALDPKRNVWILGYGGLYKLTRLP